MMLIAKIFPKYCLTNLLFTYHGCHIDTLRLILNMEARIPLRSFVFSHKGRGACEEVILNDKLLFTDNYN